MKKLVVLASTAVLIVGLGLMAQPFVRDARYVGFQKAAGMESGAVEPGQIVHIPDDALCVLEIPSIGLKTTVLEGTTDEVLALAPGHYEETALPEAQGNCCIAGHRNMCGSPFLDLDQLGEDDDVILHTRAGRKSYKVIETKIVDDTDLSVIAPTEETRLTLTTCERQDGVLRRLIVVSRLVEG